MCVGYHRRRARARGRERKRSGRATIPGRAAGPRIGPRSQVEIHNAAQAASRLVASCAQLQRCVARPCGTLHGKQQGRTAALRGLGSSSYSHSTGSFWFSFDSAISTPGMHIAPLGEGRLSPPLNPGLGPVNDTVLPSLLPSVLQLTGKQDGGGKRKQTEVLLQPRCQLGPVRLPNA